MKASPGIRADTIAALEQTLADTKVALLNGEHDELPQIQRRQETLVEQLGSYRFDFDSQSASKLADVQLAAQKNATLLKAAIEGVAAVRDRLAQVRDTRTTLRTYDSLGQRREIGDAGDSGRRT